MKITRNTVSSATGNFTVGGQMTAVGPLALGATVAAPDTYLYRDAANVLAQRNGTTAQTFRLYKTFTDASNYERLTLGSDGSGSLIQNRPAGSGSAASLRLSSMDSGGSGTYLDLSISTFTFGDNTGNSWRIQGPGAGGHLLALTDNTYDIGATGPKDIYAAGVIRARAGTSTLEASMVGVANVNTTAVGNVGTGEDDLISYSLPANALSANGKGVHITAWGTTANNANGKTLKLYFGSAAILTYALVASVAGTWRIEANVFRTGVDAQDYVSEMVSIGVAGAAVTDVEVGSTTQDDGAAVVIKVTGEATSNSDIVCEGLATSFWN